MNTSGRFGFKEQIVQGLNAAITEAEDAAITAGQWPKGLPLPKSRVETPEYIANIYYTKNDGGKWVCEKTEKATGRVQTVSADTRGELALILLSAHALQTVENTDIEAENRRIDAGLPKGVDGWEDEEHEEAVRWITEHRRGAKYKEIVSILSREEGEWMYKALCSSLGGLNLSFTAPNLNVAWDSLLDNSDSFFNLVQKGKRLQREAVEEAEAESFRIAEEKFEQSKALPVEAPSPSANIVTSAEVAARRKADAENRRLSTAELRDKMRKEWTFGPTGRH